MKRIPQLDGLRGIAVLMVFVYHAVGAPMGWAGVDLFFVLSGYLITGILLRLKESQDTAGYWRSFYFRRLLRIAPPYIGFIVIVSALYPIPWRHIWFWYTFFAANIASGLGKCPIHALTPLWSLAVEEQFYFIWPWIVLLASRKMLKRIAFGILICAPILRAILTPVVAQSFVYCFTPCRADSLACGALIAIYAFADAEWIERWHLVSQVTLIAGGVLLLGLSAFHGFRHNSDTEVFNIFGYSLIVLIFGATLVCALSANIGFRQRILSSRPLRYMGQISYTFYLYHVAFIDKLALHIHSRLEILVLAFIITTLFSTLSWYLFESQILRLRLEGPARNLGAETA